MPMSAAASADFDIVALYVALDEQRRARGMSWQAVTREINDSYRDVTCRPISSSTLTGIPKRTSLEGNCVLQLLLWLGRSPESFVPGHPRPTTAETALPVVGPALILRWNPRAVYAALDERRIALGLTWLEVADEVGSQSGPTLTGLASSEARDSRGVMRIVG